MKRATIPARSNGKHAGGRPSKFPKYSAQFLRHIESGQSISSAAGLSGLAESTVFSWLASARNAQGGAFSEFLERYTRARGKAQGKMIQEIREAGQQDWRAVAWLAEKMFPEVFSPKLRHELTGPDGAPITISAVSSFPQVRILTVPDSEFEQIATKPTYRTLDDGTLERTEGSLRIVLCRQSKSSNLLDVDL
jgi:hypothetical protein